MKASSARRRGSALRLQQVVEALVAQALDLVRREGRVEQHLGEELERLAQPRRRHLDADARRVPAGVGVQGSTQSLGRLRQADGVVAFRALGECPGGQHGRPALARRLVDGADGQDDRRARQRPAGEVGHQDREPVVELRPGDVGEVVRARLAGRRSLGDHVAVALDLVGGGHAATSSSWSRSASVSFSAFSSTASESAGAISGR